MPRLNEVVNEDVRRRNILANRYLLPIKDEEVKEKPMNLY